MLPPVFVCVHIMRRGAGTPIFLGSCHSRRSEGGCEIQLIVITGSRGLHTLYLLARADPSHAPYLHCVNLSAFARRSHRRLTATSLTSVNKVEGGKGNEMSCTWQNSTKELYNSTTLWHQRKDKAILFLAWCKINDHMLCRWPERAEPPHFCPERVRKGELLRTLCAQSLLGPCSQ